MTDRIPLDDMTSDQLDQLYDQLDALRAVARGYCPACGRGDAAPTVEDWEQQRQRAVTAEQHLRAAEFTARHWHQALIDDIPAAHAIACISAAIGGQTDPNQLGLDPSVHDAFRAALDQPAPTAATQATDGWTQNDDGIWTLPVEGGTVLFTNRSTPEERAQFAAEWARRPAPEPIDQETLAKVVAGLAQSGLDTPGCDCGHDGMGVSWHSRYCHWRAGLRIQEQPDA